MFPSTATSGSTTAAWGQLADARPNLPNCERNAAECVSLPMFPELTGDESTTRSTSASCGTRRTGERRRGGGSRAVTWPRGLSALAALLLAACAAPPRADQPRPSFDIHQIASQELLREANHGRTIEGVDGRFVIPHGVRRAWIDVGAHLLETTRASLKHKKDLALIAVEPLAECWKQWPDNERLIALPVAISIDRGSMDFHVNAFNNTSSLLKSVEGNLVDKLTRTVEVRKVPVLRLEDVLERIPPEVEVEYLKTDVQGVDLQVLKSAGEQLRRVERVRAEVINARIYEGSGDLQPGTEADFVAYMASKGFQFAGDDSVHKDRAWLDKDFVNPQRVNPQRQGWLTRAHARIRSWLP